MKTVTRRIYGPHPAGGKGRRVLLAFEGQQVSDEEYRRLVDAEQGKPTEPSPEVGDGRSRFIAGVRVDDVPAADGPPADDEPQSDEPDEHAIDDEPTEVELRHVGGGWYELPDGERFRGRDKAEAALAELRDA